MLIRFYPFRTIIKVPLMIVCHVQQFWRCETNLVNAPVSTLYVWTGLYARRQMSSRSSPRGLCSRLKSAGKGTYVTFMLATAVFLNIKGALDSVSHKAIRNALCYAGIGGRLYAWILDYLENRTVHMGTTEGKTAEYIVARGVPEGVVLSPTLFNITLVGLVNKLPRNVRLTLYEDDICIWTSWITQRFNVIRLQKALEIISNYLKCRGLSLCPSKSAAIAFTRKSALRHQLTIDAHPISYVQTHRFLGLILDKGLTWIPHVRQLKRKLISITQLLRFISGTTWGASVASLIQLYNALFCRLYWIQSARTSWDHTYKSAWEYAGSSPTCLSRAPRMYFQCWNCSWSRRYSHRCP